MFFKESKRGKHFQHINTQHEEPVGHLPLFIIPRSLQVWSMVSAGCASPIAFSNSISHRKVSEFGFIRKILNVWKPNAQQTEVLKKLLEECVQPVQS